MGDDCDGLAFFVGMGAGGRGKFDNDDSSWTSCATGVGFEKISEDDVLLLFDYTIVTLQRVCWDLFMGDCERLWTLSTTTSQPEWRRDGKLSGTSHRWAVR